MSVAGQARRKTDTTVPRMLLTRKEATMIAIANFIGLPLLFFSSVLIASSLIPHWMRTLSLGNPLEWSVRAARELVLLGSTDWGEIGLYLALLLDLCLEVLGTTVTHRWPPFTTAMSSLTPSIACSGAAGVACRISFRPTSATMPAPANRTADTMRADEIRQLVAYLNSFDETGMDQGVAIPSGFNLCPTPP